ncbi:hypothetical protein BC829DRAFT_220204 [Chytridium lagenaria]|nr:hypothetical protein BC829DRAFT_220204 [Chytridium lagenaria]
MLCARVEDEKVKQLSLSHRIVRQQKVLLECYGPAIFPELQVKAEVNALDIIKTEAKSEGVFVLEDIEENARNVIFPVKHIEKRTIAQDDLKEIEKAIRIFSVLVNDNSPTLFPHDSDAERTLSYERLIKKMYDFASANRARSSSHTNAYEVIHRQLYVFVDSIRAKERIEPWDLKFVKATAKYQPPR